MCGRTTHRVKHHLPRVDVLACVGCVMLVGECARFQWYAGDLIRANKVHNDQISHLSYSGDGQILLASSADQPAMLLGSGLETRFGDLPGISEPINCASWCGTTVASADARFDIHFHHITHAAHDMVDVACLRTWTGHTDCVVAVDWAPNQWLLASCSEDRSVRLWGTHQVRCLSCISCLYAFASLSVSQSCLTHILHQFCRDVRSCKLCAFFH